jgi:hypothetical protein
MKKPKGKKAVKVEIAKRVGKGDKEKENPLMKHMGVKKAMKGGY